MWSSGDIMWGVGSMFGRAGREEAIHVPFRRAAPSGGEDHPCPLTLRSCERNRARLLSFIIGRTLPHPKLHTYLALLVLSAPWKGRQVHSRWQSQAPREVNSYSEV